MPREPSPENIADAALFAASVAAIMRESMTVEDLNDIKAHVPVLYYRDGDYIGSESLEYNSRDRLAASRGLRLLVEKTVKERWALREHVLPANKPPR